MTWIRPRLFGSLYDCHSTKDRVGIHFLSVVWMLDVSYIPRHCLGFPIFERSVQLRWDKSENCVFTKAIFREGILGILIHKVTYNFLFHFIHYFPVPSQSSNLNSFMHWIDTKFIKHLLPAKEHSRDWDYSCKQNRIPK